MYVARALRQIKTANHNRTLSRLGRQHEILTALDEVQSGGERASFNKRGCPAVEKAVARLPDSLRADQIAICFGFVRPTSPVFQTMLERLWRLAENPVRVFDKLLQSFEEEDCPLDPERCAKILEFFNEHKTSDMQELR